MKKFIITEACFHAAYLIDKNIESKNKAAIILRNKKNVVVAELDIAHATLAGKKSLSQQELMVLENAYKTELSSAEKALINMCGVPKYHTLTITPDFVCTDLNAAATLDWLSNKAKQEPLAAVIFLDCILQPAWLDIFANRIVNAHSAILPRARGMYAIEQIAALGNEFEFERCAGASLHYIDEKVDIGLLIKTQPLPQLWKYQTLWQVKAASYLTAFSLMCSYLQQPTAFSHSDGTSYQEALGPVFRAKDFTLDVRLCAEESFASMRQQQLRLAHQHFIFSSVTSGNTTPEISIQNNNNLGMNP